MINIHVFPESLNYSHLETYVHYRIRKRNLTKGKKGTLVKIVQA